MSQVFWYFQGVYKKTIIFGWCLLFVSIWSGDQFPSREHFMYLSVSRLILFLEDCQKMISFLKAGKNHKANSKM